MITLEEYTQNDEKNARKWHSIYDEKAKEAEAKIDELLADLTNENLMKLISLFETKDIQTQLRKTKRIGYMICVMSIFAQELTSGEENTILGFGSSIDDFISLLMQIKFLLWRIEFEDSEEAAAEIVEFIKVDGASPQLIAAMIKHVSPYKKKMYLKLAKIMEENGLIRHKTYLEETALKED